MHLQNLPSLYQGKQTQPRLELLPCMRISMRPRFTMTMALIYRRLFILECWQIHFDIEYARAF